MLSRSGHIFKGLNTLRRNTLQHPTRLVPLTFLAAIALGTLVLMLPVSHTDNLSVPLLTALFTAVSAVCVTGLSVVDTAVYWSGFGQAVILILFQIGGLGIMTGATLLGMLVSNRMQLSQRLIAQSEIRSLGLGDVVDVLKMILIVTVSVELVVAVILTIDLHFSYNEPWLTALWNGVFHSVSAFNNAGFSTYSDSLMRFESSPVVVLSITSSLLIGGLGFPVLLEIFRQGSQTKTWSIHTRITLIGTAILLIGGTVAILAYEWSNPNTLGPLSWWDKFLGAFFHSATARTAGFNTLDIGEMHAVTLVVNYVLMFIGGGSAGTAGGIKVTTFFLLLFVVWAEIRGNADTTAFNRRIAYETQRQALAIVLLSAAVVSVATIILLSVTSFQLQDVLFETISAFATVGMTTGITPDLPPSGQLVIIVLMFIGRVGTITVAAALALRSSTTPYRYPEERPLVG